MIKRQNNENRTSTKFNCQDKLLTLRIYRKMFAKIKQQFVLRSAIPEKQELRDDT